MHYWLILLTLIVGAVALAGVAAWGLMSLGLLVIAAIALVVAIKIWPRQPRR